MKFSRIRRFVKRYGAVTGTRLYVDFKLNRLSGIRIPGIELPFALRKNSSDIAVFDQVFLDREYEVDIPFTPRVIIDAGANIGLFSILMKNRFPHSKIICIEPDTNNFELLRKNLSEYDGVSLVNAGLWNKPTKLKMVDRYNGNYSAMAVEEDAQDGTVRAITIGDLMSDGGIDRIDILKIDIEAAEEFVFQKNFESWLPKVKMIIIELHDWMKEGCSKPFFAAINQSFRNYSSAVHGENTIIVNDDI